MRKVCGLDVYKDSIFLCIMSSMGQILEKKYGVIQCAWAQAEPMVASLAVSPTIRHKSEKRTR